MFHKPKEAHENKPNRNLHVDDDLPTIVKPEKLNHKLLLFSSLLNT